MVNTIPQHRNKKGMRDLIIFISNFPESKTLLKVAKKIGKGDFLTLCISDFLAL